MGAEQTVGHLSNAAAELVGLEGPSTLHGVIQVEVTGGAEGDAPVRLVFDHGVLTALGVEPGEPPDATLTLTASDARDIVERSLDPSVAFMQGRMKVSGDMAVVLDALALSATSDARARLARVAALS